MSFEIYTIASGSTGNCIYAAGGDTRVLIDVGISKKKIEEGLKTINLTPSAIDAVLITHEHIDHISGLSTLSNKYHIPIYATRGTIDGIRQSKTVKEIDRDLFRVIAKEETFQIGDLNIYPISVPHDANDPVAYKIESGDKKMAIATDIGYVDDHLIDSLYGTQLLLLESNHDIRILQAGDYPYSLKQRILGRGGHLSNDAASLIISKLEGTGLRSVILGHLSKHNNFPALAYESAKAALRPGSHTTISVAEECNPYCRISI